MLNQLYCSFIDHPKNMSFQGEDSDEHIVFIVRKHFITNLGWILLSILFISVPTIVDATLLVSPFFNTPAWLRFILAVSFFWYLFCFGFILERFLNWFFNIYIVTSKRIVDMDFHNVLNSNTSETPLTNVEDVTFEIKGVMAIIFNYGNVMIQTAGESREFDFEHVGHPAKVADLISDLVKDLRKKG